MKNGEKVYIVRYRLHRFDFPEKQARVEAESDEQAVKLVKDIHPGCIVTAIIDPALVGDGWVFHNLEELGGSQ